MQSFSLCFPFISYVKEDVIWTTKLKVYFTEKCAHYRKVNKVVHQQQKKTVWTFYLTMPLVNYSFFREIYSALDCWDFVAFNHIEKSRPSTSWHWPDSWKCNKEKDNDEGYLDSLKPDYRWVNEWIQESVAKVSMWHRRNLALFQWCCSQ